MNCSELYRHALVAAKPDVFSVPAHYQNYAMVVVRLERVDAAEFKDLLREAWRMVAPKKLLEKE